MADTADIKFLNRCRRHLDIFLAEARWNSSNTRLALTALEAKLAGGFQIAADVSEKFAQQQILINRRQDVYAKIPSFARKLRRYFRSCGATENEIADCERYVNDLLGVAKPPKPPKNTDGDGASAANTHSMTQLSYDGMYANLQALRAFVGNVTAFKPNEEPLALTGFDAFIEECREANEAVSENFAPLSSAWNLRDDELYNNDGSVFEDFRDAKEYYKSLYDAQDPQYKTITAKDMLLVKGGRR